MSDVVSDHFNSQILKALHGNQNNFKYSLCNFCSSYCNIETVSISIPFGFLFWSHTHVSCTIFQTRQRITSELKTDLTKPFKKKRTNNILLEKSIAEILNNQNQLVKFGEKFTISMMSNNIFFHFGLVCYCWSGSRL